MKSLVVSSSVFCLAAGLALTVSSLPCSAADDQAPPAAIKLESLKWAEFKERLASNKQAKYTLVDAWATTCGPCKENFPHLVEMHHKYGAKGLVVVSLSLDDPTDAKAVAAAEKFLKEKKAVITNVLLNEDYGDGFDKLAISAIPAVFLFGPDGKEVKRFTMDDPNHQFTYEHVEKEVRALLEGSEAATPRK
jgi:thiol-disulfide isomerase/thioredoxin